MKTKSIVITDDSVLNSFGFRVLTDGGDLSQYMTNPILLFDHVRRDEKNGKDIILPIGRMNDIQRIGTQYVARPHFDLQDTFAAEVARKYEQDVLNMASIGFDIIEVSDDPSMMLPGQLLPTVTKWILKEVSITDIGANHKCCKVLHKGELITLSKKSSVDINSLLQSYLHIKPMSLRDEFIERAALEKQKDQSISFSFGEGNNAMSSQLTTEAAPVVENENILISSLDKPLFLPEVYSIKAKLTRQQLMDLQTTDPDADANVWQFIEFSDTNKNYKRGYVLEAKPSPDSNECDLTLLRANI